MTIQDSTITVNVTEPNGTVHPLTKDTDYTLENVKDETTGSETGAKTIKVTWAKDNDGDGEKESIYQNGSVLTIEYKATLNDITATNHATTKTNEYEGPSGETTVTTHSFTLVKTDKDTSKVLDGAEFHLYRDEDCTDEVKLTEDASTGVYTVSKNGTAVISAGNVKIQGLEDDTYYLKETKAPQGYNKLSAPVPVTVSAASDKATTEVKVGGIYTNVSGVLEVENQSGSELPSTGGIGTTIFYVVGGILVAGAAITLVVRKRMSNYQD